MKVLLVNGSPHEKGCTYTALTVAAQRLQQSGIETEIFWLGAQPIGGCIGCGGCKANDGLCVFGGVTNDFITKAKQADGFIFGSPVHYAAISGSIKCLLDRAFTAGNAVFRYKPAAFVVSGRRAGTTTALDQLAKYPMLTHMPIVGTGYWPMVHGSTPEQVLQDVEGIAVIEQMAANMAWLMQCIQKGADCGLFHPDFVPRPRTDFIR